MNFLLIFKLSLHLAILALLGEVTGVKAHRLGRDLQYNARGLKPLLRRAPTPTTIGLERRDVPSHLTNAERLARHLPLKAPTRRSPGHLAAREGPSSVPLVQRKVIVEILRDGQHFGYMGYTENGAPTATKTTGLGQAIQLTFSYNPSVTGPQLVQLSMNSASAYPLLGLVAGWNNVEPRFTISSGSPNYATISGIGNPGTPIGSTPAAVSNTLVKWQYTLPAETYVWLYDHSTSRLSLTWVNPDGSSASPLSIVHTASWFDGLYLVTNVQEFSARMGLSNVVTLRATDAPSVMLPL